MPHFESSCNVQHCGRKLTDSELIRAIRFNIAAEYKAAQIYEQVAESTDNKLAQCNAKFSLRKCDTEFEKK